MPGWLTPSAVVAHVDVTGVQATSTALVNACAAVEAWVEQTVRPDLTWAAPGFTVPADVKLGGLMLAWRYYERRNTPLGLVITGTGDPVEMLRHDPDIARLLGVSSGGGFFGGVGPVPPGTVTT